MKTQSVFTTPALARRIGRHPGTVRNLIKSGKLKATNDGTPQMPQWSILWSDYLDYRDRHSNQSLDTATTAKEFGKPKRRHV